MTGGENAEGKWSEEKLDGEESLRTVDCLRGRLLAERMASRNAKMEAEQLGNKLSELESLLKKEAKSRNRAEKKLKSLMKKLESKNILYDSSESGLLDRSDITSTSSSSTVASKSAEKNSKVPQMRNLRRNNDSQTSISSHGSPATEDNCTSSELDGKQCHNDRETEDVVPVCPALGLNPSLEVIESSCQNLSSPDEVHSERFGEIESNQNCSISNVSVKSCAEEEKDEECDRNKKMQVHDQNQEKKQQHDHSQEKNEENDEDEENRVDNSLALVPVETPEKTEQSIDPEVLDATVKEVLDALRHAKEQLQSSMDRKRRSVNVIKVG